MSLGTPYPRVVAVLHYVARTYRRLQVEKASKERFYVTKSSALNLSSPPLGLPMEWDGLYQKKDSLVPEKPISSLLGVQVRMLILSLSLSFVQQHLSLSFVQQHLSLSVYVALYRSLSLFLLSINNL